MNYRFKREYDDIIHNIQKHNMNISTKTAVENETTLNEIKKFKLTPSVEQKTNYQLNNLKYGIDLKKTDFSKDRDKSGTFYTSMDDILKIDSRPKKWSELDLYYKKKYILDYIRVLQVQFSISENDLLQFKTTVFNALYNKELLRNVDVDYDIENNKIRKIDRIEYTNNKLIYHSVI